VLTNNNLDVRPVDFWVCFTQVGDFITIADELLRSHAATQFGSVGPLEFHSVKTIARPRGGRTCKTNSFNTPSAGFIANPLRKESSPDHPTRNVHLKPTKMRLGSDRHLSQTERWSSQKRWHAFEWAGRAVAAIQRMRHRYPLDSKWTSSARLAATCLT
jgi:hypothetical protein